MKFTEFNKFFSFNLICLSGWGNLFLYTKTLPLTNTSDNTYSNGFLWVFITLIPVFFALLSFLILIAELVMNFRIKNKFIIENKFYSFFLEVGFVLLTLPAIWYFELRKPSIIPFLIPIALFIFLQKSKTKIAF